MSRLQRITAYSIRYSTGDSLRQMLKTDISLMSDADIKEWISSIIENTHVSDLRTLIKTVSEELEKYDNKILFCTIWEVYEPDQAT